MIYVTGDLHGGESSYHVTSAQFKPAKRGDIVLCCGDFGGVWWHDYATNNKHRRSENGFLELTLRQRVMWLTVDGNHENFDRLFSGEFPIVEIYGGKAYKIRDNIYYLKRGEVFTIEGRTFFAFGGANSHDRFGAKVPSLAWGGGYDTVPARVEGKDWWPQEIPSQDDFDNACHNLDKVGWKVDHVITHTCPVSVRPYILRSSRIADPTENMLQEIYEKLTFKTWHFGHFHLNTRLNQFHCHFNKVQSLDDLVAVQDPRIRDLPEEEREAFNKWMMVNGQTRPGPALKDNDFFYQHDYESWKSRNRGDLLYLGDTGWPEKL